MQKINEAKDQLRMEYGRRHRTKSVPLARARRLTSHGHNERSVRNLSLLDGALLH